MADATSHTVPLFLAALGLALLAALAVWLGPSRDQPQSPAPGAADTTGEVAAPVARAETAAPSRTPTADAPTEGERSQAPSAQPAPPRALGRVLLRAIRFDDETAVPEFTWTLEIPGSAVTTDATGAAQGGYTYVPVPLGEIAVLRVTAEGFVPSLAVDASLLDGAATREVVARLVPRLTGPSAVLTVTDDVERPITRLFVTVEREDRTGSRQNEWRTVQRFESRAADGAHAFTDLDPARYRLRLVALQDDGRPALWVPVTEAFRFSGTRRVDRSVRLAPAGSIVLELRDGDRLLGPGTDIALIDPAGRRRHVAWRAVDGDPAEPATGTLPAAEPCELAEPVLPGTYTLRITGAGLDVTQPVTIWVGQRTTVRLP